MKRAFYLISGIQVAYVLVGSFFDAIFPNWLLLTMVLGLSAIILGIKGRQPFNHYIETISFYFVTIGLIFLLMSNQFALYLGYSFAILGQIGTLCLSLIQKKYRDIWRDLALFAAIFIVLEFLGFVIVPPNPFNTPLFLMMALGSLLIYNLLMPMLGRFHPVRIITAFLVSLAFLFTGLAVINTAFNPNSILAIINNGPWHLGVLIMTIAHVFYNYQFMIREPQHG